MGKEREKTRLVNILTKLVEIPTYGKIGIDHEAIKYLDDLLRCCNEICKIEDDKGNVHLLIGVNCNLNNINNSILLSGHIDTVRESEGHNSYVTIKEDDLFGLGVSDMKAFIAIIIANIEFFKSLSIPIIISITSDEEAHLNGIKLITKELQKRNIHSNLIIIGEPTNLDYYISSRGNSINVSVMKGVTAHSGSPELGINAIELIGDFMEEIKKISKEFEQVSSTCITSISGGKIPSNVVPDESSLCFGIRTSNRKTLNNMLTRLHKRHDEIARGMEGSVLFNVLDIPPFERKHSEFIIKQAHKNKKNLVDARYSTEAGFFQSLYPSSNIVIYGPGNPACIHEPGESISKTNLYTYNSEIIRFINDYLKYEEFIVNDSKRLIMKNN